MLLKQFLIWICHTNKTAPSHLPSFRHNTKNTPENPLCCCRWKQEGKQQERLYIEQMTCSTLLIECSCLYWTWFSHVEPCDTVKNAEQNFSSLSDAPPQVPPTCLYYYHVRAKLCHRRTTKDKTWWLLSQLIQRLFHRFGNNDAENVWLRETQQKP